MNRLRTYGEKPGGFAVEAVWSLFEGIFPEIYDDGEVVLTHRQKLNVPANFPNSKMLIFGYNNEYQTPAFKPSETAWNYPYANTVVLQPTIKEHCKYVTSPEGVVVSEYNPETDFTTFFVELTGSSEFSIAEQMIVTETFNMITNGDVNAFIAERKNARFQASIPAIKDRMVRHLKDNLDNERRNLLSLEEKIDVRIKEVANLSRQKREKLMLVSGGDEYISIEADKLVKELSELSVIPDLDYLEFEGSSLTVHTNTIYSIVKGKKYRFGKYKIVINVDNNSVRFFNKSEADRRTSYWSSKDHHPHVNKDGKPCLGNTASMFAEVLSDNQYNGAIIIAINFLRTVNTDDPAGRKYVNWDRVE